MMGKPSDTDSERSETTHVREPDPMRHGQFTVVMARKPAPASTTVSIPLHLLTPSDSPRLAGESDEHVHALAALDRPLPPIVVHRTTMRVVDGMHRLKAAALRHQDRIGVVFFDGNSDEAFIEAVRRNAHHGLPLSRADRTAAVVRILETHSHWSNAAIAATAGVSDKTVATIRARSTSKIPRSNGRVGHDGRVRPVNPALGRRRAAEFLGRNPDATLREIARTAGIAIGTAKDVRERLRNGQDPLPPRVRKIDDEPRWLAPPGMFGRGDPSSAARAAGTFDDLVAVLKRDPSLRLSESGRVLLRLLDAHASHDDDWERLVESIPAHCTRAIADAAQRCVNSWRRIAALLESRTFEQSASGR
ncbi:Transcriptional regulator NovG [Amycolatopsis sp. M39]|uniref:ParB-like nuclease domain-containing protein n=2 Tax=Amycolatopsis rubida TaxID=112413 RepID=A0A1I5ZBJ3_9PSEU|nr:Transcriptional regulator NovG [Amycolatopsis sp. M39]SFQ53841.1 ParB-like nuclease domain-containing protein [Amycolatopsis rubida]